MIHQPTNFSMFLQSFHRYDIINEENYLLSIIVSSKTSACN